MWEFLTFSHVLHLGPLNAWSLSAHRALVPPGPVLLPAWVGDWGSPLEVGDGPEGLACCDSWGRKESDTSERLNWTELSVSVQPADFCKGCFCPCSFSTLYLKRYSWRTLFFLIALSSHCSLRTSFPSSRLQSLADTNPVLSLPTWDLELTFY